MAPGKRLLSLPLDLLLQAADLIAHVGEPWWPRPAAELFERRRGVLPSLLVDLGGGQTEQARRFEGPEPGDLLPVDDGLAPSGFAPWRTSASMV